MVVKVSSLASTPACLRVFFMACPIVAPFLGLNRFSIDTFSNNASATPLAIPVKSTCLSDNPLSAASCIALEAAEEPSNAVPADPAVRATAVESIIDVPS